MAIKFKIYNDDTVPLKVTVNDENVSDPTTENPPFLLDPTKYHDAWAIADHDGNYFIDWQTDAPGRQTKYSQLGLAIAADDIVKVTAGPAQAKRGPTAKSK